MELIPVYVILNNRANITFVSQNNHEMEFIVLGKFENFKKPNCDYYTVEQELDSLVIYYHTHFDGERETVCDPIRINHLSAYTPDEHEMVKENVNQVGGIYDDDSKYIIEFLIAFCAWINLKY